MACHRAENVAVSRAPFLALLLLATGCSLAGSNAAEPPPEAIASAEPITSELLVEIDGESFVLRAAICNTYDDGTFQFALAEGSLGEGNVAATIERFDNDGIFHVLIALEGTRGDGSQVSWYAADPHDVYEIESITLGPSLQGTAVFDSIGGAAAPGLRASGSFSVTCA